MDDVAKRLDKAVEIGGFKSRRKMCESLKIPYGTLNNWIKRGKITSSGILTITENFPQISKTYLETGEGDILKLDTGISNYGHDARTKEVCEAYQAMSNEDKEIVYNIVKRFRKNEGIRLTAFDEDFEDKE